jgi:hypothetical protein
MQEILEETINFIDCTKMELVKLLNLKISSNVISISTNELYRDYNKHFLHEIESKKSVIYIIRQHNNDVIKEYFEDFKKNNPKIKMPKLNNLNSNPEVMYIGSVMKNFKRRLKEHLGFGSDKTYSLQIRKWLKKDTIITIEYYIFDNQINELTLRIIESKFASTLKPTFGKHLI